MNADQLTKALTQQYGRFIKGKDLMLELGFSSQASFARARKLGLVEVNVFDLEGRRGPFAFTQDVAEWVAALATKKSNPISSAATQATRGGDMT